MNLSEVVKKMHVIWAGFNREKWALSNNKEEEIDGRIHLARITYIKVGDGQITTRVGEIYKIDKNKKGATIHYIDWDRGKRERSCKVKNLLSISVLEQKVYPTKV